MLHSEFFFIKPRIIAFLISIIFLDSFILLREEYSFASILQEEKEVREERRKEKEREEKRKKGMVRRREERRGEVGGREGNGEVKRMDGEGEDFLSPFSHLP